MYTKSVGVCAGGKEPRPPTLCKRDLVSLPTLILIIVLCYVYIASLINCIQPDDGDSSIGRNM